MNLTFLQAEKGEGQARWALLLDPSLIMLTNDHAYMHKL